MGSMSINLLFGIGIVAILFLAAMIGTVSDTQKRDGLKWFLVVLIILGAAAGGAREYFRDKSDKEVQKKLTEALTMVKSSDERCDEKVRGHEQSFAKEREGIKSAIEQSRASSTALVEQIISLASSIEEIEKATEDAKKDELVELGIMARLDASKKLVATAKEGEWMAPPRITNLEAWFKEDIPLQDKQFDEIKESLGKKPLVSDEATR